MSKPAANAGSAERRSLALDLGPFAICSLIWGTTWFAITHQLGEVPAVVSVIYRFGLASILLFAWLAATKRPIRLNREQHLATLGQGVFTFGINYLFVYMAEEKITSAVVAVLFAALAFVNLIIFRAVLGQKAARGAWIGAALGVAGVAALSWAELQRADMDVKAWTGLGFGVMAMLGAAVGNIFAHRAQKAGVDIGANTAWGMAYGTGLLAIVALVTRQPFKFEWTLGYVGSLAYLTVFGSVTAFLLYFYLARRRGYSFASYVSAVTPPIAMLVSAVFENVRWGWEALLGVALVVAGQVLLLRAPKAP